MQLQKKFSKVSKPLVLLFLFLQCLQDSKSYKLTNSLSYGIGPVIPSGSTQRISSSGSLGGSFQISSGSSSSGGTTQVISGGVLPVISTGTVSRDGTVGDQQFTITNNLLNFINAVRGQTGVIPQIKTNNDGTYDITAQTSQGTQSIKGISKNALSVFVLLFKNPSLKIKTLSKNGNDVTIQVESTVSGVTNTVQIDANTLKTIKNILANPNLEVTKVTQDGDNYVIVLADGTKTQTLTLPKIVALPFLNKLRNPNLQLKITNTADGGATIQIPQFPKHQTTFSVGKLFLEVLNLVRQNPSAKITIEPTGSTFTLVITINGEKKTYSNLQPSLVQVFSFLANNPSISFKVVPGNDGKSTIVLPSNIDVTTSTTTIPSDITAKLEKILSNPNVKVEIIEPSENNYQLVITEGTQKKVISLPSSAIQVVVQLLKQKIPNFTIVKGPGNDVVSVDHSKPETHTIPTNVITLLKNIFQHPTDKVSFNIKEVSDDNYELTITVNGKTDTLHNLNPKVVQIIVNQIHHPKTKIPTTDNGDGTFTITDPSTLPGGTVTTGTSSGPSSTSSETDTETTSKPTSEPVTSPVTQPTSAPTTKPSGTSGSTLPEVTPVHNDKLDLLKEVKNAPHLTISVKPTNDNHYDITLDDGTTKKYYAHLTINELTLLIKVRNEKHLPFEITPSPRPGYVNVIVPDSSSPDTIHIPVNPDVIEVIDQLKHEPTTHIKIHPNTPVTYAVNVKSDKIDKTYQNIKPDVLQIIVRLRTDDTLNVGIAPGENGKVTLLVPKQQQKPVHTTLTPEIIDIIKTVKQNPDKPIVVKPSSSPDTFTIIISGKSYPNLPSELIPIVVQLYSHPSIDLQIKPGKDNTIEFVPASPTPDSQSFKVSYSVIDIITTIRNNPSSQIQVKPQPDHDFTVIITVNGHSKKYPNLTPDSLRIIFDLQANSKLPYTVTPTTDGHIIINIPKTSAKHNTVPIEPETKNVLSVIRKNPNVNVDIKPDTKGTYIITLDGKTYTNVSPSFLLLIITLLSKPTLKFEVVPGFDGKLSITVPKETPKTIQVKVSSNLFNLFHILRDGPDPEGSVQRNIQGGGFDITVSNNGKTAEASNVSPELLNIFGELGPNPSLPFHFYPEGNDYILIIPKRPKELTLKNVPHDIIKFVSKERTEPNLKLVVKNHGVSDYDLIFKVKDKVVKSFPHSNTDTVRVVLLLIENTNIEVTFKPNADGSLSVPTLDIPTLDFTINPNQVSLIYDVQSPNLSSLNIKPNNGKYDVTVDISGHPKTFNDVDGKVVFILILLRTERNIDINIYITSDGSLQVAIPRGSIRDHFDGINKDFYNYLIKIQPDAKHVTFRLSFNGIYYILDIQSSIESKRFTHLPGIAVELFIKFLLNPDLTLQSSPGTDGTLDITLVRQITTLIFKNVKSKFLSLAKSIREDGSTSVSIKRTTDLLVVLAQGNKGISFENVNPILIQLFVALFSDPNFQYKSHLETDGTTTLTIQNFNQHPVFNNIDSELASVLKQLHTASTAAVLITHAKHNCGFDVAIAVNGGSAHTFENIDSDSLRLIIIFLTNKGVKFVEDTKSGRITFDITLEKVSNPVFYFNLFTVVAKVIDDVAKFLGSVFGSIIKGIGNLIGGVISGIGGLLGVSSTKTTTTTVTSTDECGIVRNSQHVGVTTSTSGGLLGSIVKAGTDVVGGVVHGAANVVGGVAQGAAHVVGGVAKGAANVVGRVASAGTHLTGSSNVLGGALKSVGNLFG